MKKNIVANYQMIKHYYYHPSNMWLALSEFLDNSISSWSGKENQNPIDGLKIDIIFDETTKNNNKIIIKDNAKGMKEEELLNAMQPNNSLNKESHHYNQYGIGMKFGCFWYGENAAIYTKTENDNEYKVVLETLNKSPNESVVVESEISNDNLIKTKSGTVIVISNVYADRFPSNSKIATIKTALGWRYSKLIKKGLIINIEIKSNDKKKNSVEKITEFEIKPFKFDDFVAVRKDENKNNPNFQNQVNKWIDDIIELKEKTLYELNALKEEEDETRKRKRILIEFCEKFINGQELFVSKEIIVNNKKVNFNFGIISPKEKNLNKISGVTTYHIDRAINHGPNDDENKSPPICFDTNKNVGSGGDPTWRHLYGDVDLTYAEIPDINKSGFLWSNEGKDNLYKEIKNVWESLKKLLNKINEFKNDTPTKTIDTNKEFDETINNINDVLDNNILQLSKKSDEDNYEKKYIDFQLVNKKRRIRIVETNGEKDKFIKISSYNDNNNITLITFNVNHQFWKPFINKEKTNSNYRGRTVYPIVLILAICNELFKNNNHNNALLDGIDLDKNKELFQIINDIVTQIQKKE